jgi:hypothetical protein
MSAQVISISQALSIIKSLPGDAKLLILALPTKVRQKKTQKSWTPDEVAGAIRLICTNARCRERRLFAAEIHRSYGSVSAKLSNIRRRLTGKGWSKCGRVTTQMTNEFLANKKTFATKWW